MVDQKQNRQHLILKVKELIHDLETKQQITLKQNMALTSLGSTLDSKLHYIPKKYGNRILMKVSLNGKDTAMVYIALKMGAFMKVCGMRKA